MSRVSVIIPTHNRLGLLRAAVESILRQTRSVEQIVIVDDGSDDPDRLSDLAALSGAIEVVHHATARGPAAARNSGLARAHGDYVIFLDDDDLLAPTFVARGLSVLDGNPGADGVFFRYWTVCSDDCRNGTPEPPRDFATSFFRGDNPVSRPVLEQRASTAFLRYLVPIHSGFIRRSAIGDRRFPEKLAQGEDTYFWISLSAAGCRFVLDDQPCALLRRHAGNMTKSFFRHVRDIQPCYRMLLDQRLLSDPDDAYLAHLKLLWFGALTGSGDVVRHARHVARSPDRLVAEALFWLRNFSARLRRGAEVNR